MKNVRSCLLGIQLRPLLWGIATAFLSGAALADEKVAPHHLVGHEEAPLLRRVQKVIDDWDPRKLENPLVVTSEAKVPVVVKGKDDTKIVPRKQLRRPDLAEFIADVDAVEALGKALFWEMQAGSDFKRHTDGTMVGTACASCHYRHGADARNRHTTRIPFVAWDRYKLHENHPLEFGQQQESYPVARLAAKEVPFQTFQPAGPYSLIVGSQGVESFVFKGFRDQGDATTGRWKEELTDKRSINGFRHLPEWAMFLDADFTQHANGIYKVTERHRFRQITNRNSPTVINSVFSDRQFHDGRAESTFNGFSIFGDADPREVIHRRRVSQVLDADGRVVSTTIDIVPVKVAVTNASLASQAVGPIVNDIEMSYLGRQFPNVAYKLLDAGVLRFQDVDPTDSCLRNYSVGKTGTLTYRTLIQRAFRREWWDDSDLTSCEKTTPLILLRDCEENSDPRGSLMEANFSLYWGLAIMFYEASLVSNQSPFDDMMRGRTEKVEAKWASVKNGAGPDDQLQPIRRDQRTPQPPPEHVSGSAVFQHGFRVFLNRGCIDCHSGPLLSEVYKRRPDATEFPIHSEIERTLLPNSRADSLIFNLKDRKAQMLSRIGAAIEAEFSAVADRSSKIAIELDLLREKGDGERKALFAKVKEYLDAAFPRATSIKIRAVANRLTNYLFDYEKLHHTLLGNRPFFTEDERIAMAELLVDPVLIEKMPIPEKQMDSRPRLPIEGPLANENYAFYDLGFYVLGVSLPRYDRGIGDKKAGLRLVEESLLKAVEAFSDSELAGDREAAEAVTAQLKKNEPSMKVLDDVRNDRIALNAESKSRLLEAIEDEQRPPVTSSPGTAYQFNPKWHSDRFKSKPEAKSEEAKPEAAIPDAASAIMCDLDADFKGKLIDTSWDRIDIPYGARRDNPQLKKNEVIPGPGRRNAYYYLARSRRLVSSEEKWGYRKPFLHENELAFWGAFKTPTLRNVELTAPFMHNGRLMTLTDVVEFYENESAGKGRVPFQLPRDLVANPDKHPAIDHVDLTDFDRRALVFFLLCLTDDRVRREQGPFDHPGIALVNGYRQKTPDAFEERVTVVTSTGEAGRQNVMIQFPTDK